MGFSTDAVHGGQSADPLTGAVITPIYQTSTYRQDGLGENRGYEYSRTHNPTREAYERNIAVLERGKHGVAFASGLAAIDAVARLFEAGDEIVITDNVYGGTRRLFEQLLIPPVILHAIVGARPDTLEIVDLTFPVTGPSARPVPLVFGTLRLGTQVRDIRK